MNSEAPAGNPIADLSYRNYDGVLRTRVVRWWIIAQAGVRLAVQKKGFWIVTIVSLLPYLAVGFMLYFQSRAPVGGVGDNPLFQSAPGQKYASMFFQAFQNQLFWLFVISLMVGPASVAADNQANALLLYLSKPLTKGDYLLGKWMSIFLTLFAIAFVPALLLYLYCLLSFLDAGFLKDEPWLFFRVFGATLIPAVIHASLHIGVSAWSKSPRMAGAVYAGLFLISGFIVMASWGIRYRGDLEQGIDLRHVSPGGVIQGLAQDAFNVTQQMVGGRRRAFARFQLPPPTLRLMAGLALLYVIVGVGAARARIRAVEVVKG